MEASREKRQCFTTSTPMEPRKVEPIIDSDSSTNQRSGDYPNGTEGDTSDSLWSPIRRSPTNISTELEKNKITPPKPESRSLEERGLFITTKNWDWAAIKNGLIRKTSSMPGLINLVSENTLFVPYETRHRSHSLSSIDRLELDSCSWPSDIKSDTKSAKEQVVIAREKIEEVLSFKPEKVEEEDHSSEAEKVEEDHSFKPEKAGEDHSFKTPKRALKFSPDTPIGLESKLERLFLNQTSSPTLRAASIFGKDGKGSIEDDLTTGQADKGGSRRKTLFGRRRLISLGCGAERIDAGVSSTVGNDGELISHFGRAERNSFTALSSSEAPVQTEFDAGAESEKKLAPNYVSEEFNILSGPADELNMLAVPPVEKLTPEGVNEEVNMLALPAVEKMTPAGVSEEVNKLALPAVEKLTPAVVSEEVNMLAVPGVEKLTPTVVSEEVNMLAMPADEACKEVTRSRKKLFPTDASEKVNKLSKPAVNDIKTPGFNSSTDGREVSKSGNSKPKNKGKKNYTKKVGKTSMIPGQKKIKELNFFTSKEITECSSPRVTGEAISSKSYVQEEAAQRNKCQENK